MMLAYRVAVASLTLLAGGCASNVATTKPANINLSQVKTFYVQKPPREGHGIELLIADRLTKMGYIATYGTGRPSQPVDAIVTYKDDWWWDLSWYLIMLDIQIRDAQTQLILVSGHSKRTPLGTKSSDEIVESMLNEMLRGRHR